jgi:GNAT superfamily N-acetyltransferase
MSRATTGLTLDTLAELPEADRACAFWETDPATRRELHSAEDRIRAKEAWLSATLLEWGCCGQICHIDGIPAGYLLYAPRSYVPAADSFATSPAADDAALLMTGQVFPQFRGSGIGRVLVQATVKDLLRRRVRAVETFAARRPQTCRQQPESPCLLPAAFLRSVGFRTVRQHPSTPRLRMDLRSVVTWRAEVESAVDRLLGSLRTVSPAMTVSSEGP